GRARPTLAVGGWAPPLMRWRNSRARRRFTSQGPVGAGSERRAEGAVELGVAAKARVLQRLRHAAAGALSVDLKESLQAQLAAVLLEHTVSRRVTGKLSGNQTLRRRQMSPPVRRRHGSRFA